MEQLEDRCLLTGPVINPIANGNLPIGKSLIVPLTAMSNNPLTYTVTSNNPDVTVQMHTGNPFLELDITGSSPATTGTMIFEMLHDVAPNTVDTIDGLVQAGFYNGLIFHRVVKATPPTNPLSVIQGGDPLGNGLGGPGFKFDDEFNVNAIFSGSGQLAMANSGPDTNGSQFFVTLGTQRFLDLTYTLFGQLVSGFNLLTAINNVAVDANSKPLSPITITSAKLITDTTDAVVTLGADSAFSGSATITVAVDDGTPGGTDSKTFTVNAFTDTTNDPPILGPVTDHVTPINTAFSFTLSATDLEGDPPSFATSGSTANLTVNLTGNQVTITPIGGTPGAFPFAVGVFRGVDSSNNAIYDLQRIIIGVGDSALTGTATSVTATALVPDISAAVASFTDADAGASPADYTSVKINWGDGHVSTGTVTQSGGTFTVSGTNTYVNPGSYPVTVDLQDKFGATLHVKGTATVSSFAGPVTLNVDNMGTPADALTDGILILRYLFGFTGTTLTGGALGSGATRSDPAAVKGYLDFARTTMLDVDQNGTADPLTDGILILRYLFGFTGTTLTGGAIGAGALRTSPTAIKAFLDGFNPGHLFADTVASGPPVGDLLTAQDLQTITQAAITRWEATGLSAVARAALEGANVQLANLSGTGLGETTGNHVQIDIDAAGHGWFIDPTPLDDAEFSIPVTGSELQAGSSSPVSGEMDLLTVVMHELGLVMGLKDIDPSVQAHSLMTDVLSVGVRRLP